MRGPFINTCLWVPSGYGHTLGARAFLTCALLTLSSWVLNYKHISLHRSSRQGIEHVEVAMEVVLHLIVGTRKQINVEFVLNWNQYGTWELVFKILSLPKPSLNIICCRQPVDPVDGTQFDKITTRYEHWEVLSLPFVHFDGEFRLIFLYCFSCRYLAQLGLRQLGLPVPNVGPYYHSNQNLYGPTKKCRGIIFGM